jgi:hypothetical protein
MNFIQNYIYYFIQKNSQNNVPEEIDGVLAYFSGMCHNVSGFRYKIK